MILIVVFTYEAFPFFYERDSLKLAYEIYTIVELNKYNWWIFYIFETLAVPLSGFIIVAYDGMFLGLLLRIGCKFDILAYQLKAGLKYLRDLKGPKKFIENEEKKVFREIIEQHQLIFK